MLYYSEVLNKTFNSESDCVEAENAYNREKEEKAKAEAEKKNEISAKKKELAKAIEESDTKITEAEAEFIKVKKEASEYLAEARKVATAKIREAEKKLNDAYAEKYEKVKAFNKDFGPYSVTYTGDRAQRELSRMTTNLNSVWDKLLDAFF